MYSFFPSCSVRDNMRLNRAQRTAILYLLSLVLLLCGFAIGKFKLFPHDHIMNIGAFVTGHELATNTSTVAKVMNDLDIEPSRFMRRYPATAASGARPLDVPGLNRRREKPLCRIDTKAPLGFHAVFGAMDFEDRLWGGLLLDEAGKVVHAWKLSTDHLPTNREIQGRKNLYGLALFGDGSVIFSQQEAGGGIVKVDGQNNVVWNLLGNYHHTISPTDDGTFWTFRGTQVDAFQNLAEVSIETGKIVRIINMVKVRQENPSLQFFNLHDEVPLAKPRGTKRAKDPLHGNDIDQLSEAFAPQFELFEAGDLLSSYRSINLIFVFDPDSLAIKWWRTGAWDRQHDSDWEADGTISVFSNNTISLRNCSDIVSIAPTSYRHKTLVDGEDFDFYSTFNGRQERTKFNTRIITSSSQGWVFEVDDDDRVVFSFVNNYKREGGTSLHMSEAYHVRRDFFTEEFLESCMQ